MPDAVPNQWSGDTRLGHIPTMAEQQARMNEREKRLRAFAEWVASHKLTTGTYADEDHPYDEWFAPDGTEADLSEVVERAGEALR